MKTNLLVRVSLGVLLLGFTMTAVARAHEGHKPAAKTAAATQSAAEKFEISFMEGMIDHHAMAVEMARVCSTRATHTELRTMCEEMKTTQLQEIATMQGWLQSWYGVTHQPQMKPGEMRQIDRLRALSGREFEIAFLEMMIQHHRKAVQSSDQCLKRATHSELRQLCQTMHDMQQSEIAQMTTWLCQWYQKCR